MTKFSDTVKNVVKNIPKGEVMTYKGVAGKAGHPKATSAGQRQIGQPQWKRGKRHRVQGQPAVLAGIVQLLFAQNQDIAEIQHINPP